MQKMTKEECRRTRVESTNAAQLYGLSRAHKEDIPFGPIVSAWNCNKQNGKRYGNVWNYWYADQNHQ